MLACRSNGRSQLFLPVFFQVDPSDLRYSSSPKSCYSEAFAKHLERNGQEVIDNWRSALHQASLVTGFTLDTAQGFEARLVKHIVSEVLDVLSRTPLDIASHPVGVKEKLKEVLAIDKAQHRLHILGIYGIGGMGKTTLAKSIYNEIYRDFDGVCYIENVRSEAKTDGLKRVQERMLRDLLKNEAIHVSNISSGKQVMRDRLSGLKILIILDDIDDREQVKALIEPFETINLKEGSQLVVTTRDEQIVIWAKAQQKVPMDGLSEADAHTLFNWHAFLNPEGPRAPTESEGPPTELIRLAKKVVDACQGLPLALETLGAYLYDKGIDIWKATVKVLEGRRQSFTPAQREVMSILRVSYDGLGNEEQVMFLDIACFMLGEREDRAKRILCCESDAAELCFETLRLKSLVKVDQNRRLRMHDLLRDMGREIMERSHKNVWWHSHETDVRTVLQQRKGARGVALSLNNQEWSVESFAGMDSLKFLLLRGPGKIIGDFGLFPTELTWFECSCCPLESLPCELSLPRELDLSKVAVLNLSRSRIASLSNGHTFENLRELYLGYSLNICELPDFNSINCKKLEVLDLSNCCNLESVSESIGCLSSTLTRLDLSRCGKLTTLPDALVSLHCLESLKLNDCTSLTRLPDAFGQLTALEHVGLEWLLSLEVLPQSLGNLTKLSSLSLGPSPSLKELPCTIGNLKKLSTLSVCGCSMAMLPEDIGKLSKLVTLELVDNDSLSHLPRSIGQLKELVNLTVTRCRIGEGGLPEEISNLSSLEYLNLSRGSFSNVPVHLQLPSELPEEIGKLSKLVTLDSSFNSRLSHLPRDLTLLSELRTLDLRDCTNLREIPPLPPSLEQLLINGCENLREIPPLPPSLEQLHISFCRQLTTLPSMSCLSQLEKFTCQGCEGLRIETSQLASLTSLRELELPVSHDLGPWMEKLVSLERVDLDGEHLPHCFNEYKQEVQVLRDEEHEIYKQEVPELSDEEHEIYKQEVPVPRDERVRKVLVTVPHTGDGKECKGLVICIAWPNVYDINIWQIGGQLVHELSFAPVHVWIYRAAKHPFVADLKGGATIELLISKVHDLGCVQEPEVAVRLLYEDHGFEEINWAARM